jgi:hypothetical protein
MWPSASWSTARFRAAAGGKRHLTRAVLFMTGLGMMIRTMKVVILFLAGWVIGLSGAAVDESGPYPIWWSPALKLESIDQLEVRLQRPLWPDRPDSGFTVFVIEDSGEREEFARNGAGMLK